MCLYRGRSSLDTFEHVSRNINKSRVWTVTPLLRPKNAYHKYHYIAYRHANMILFIYENSIYILADAIRPTVVYAT